MKAFLAVTLCAYLVLGTLVQAHEINSPAELKGDPHCPPISEGHNATLFPHPTNCSAYYECDNGEAILMDCPSGLHFNPELLVCDYVWNAGCQKTRADPRCPNPGSGQNVTFIPNPNNCSQYFECDNGNIIVMDCPSGLHFNPELLVCDHIWNAGCQKTRGDPRCPPVEEGQNVTLIPNPSNCSQFFECVGEEIVVMDCPEGLHFNPELLVCDHIWNAGCQKTRGDPRCPPVEEGQNVTLIPNPSNCSQFFECVGEEIVVMDCPEGLHFNPELLVCDHIWNAGCQKTRGDPRCPPVEEGQNVTLIPNPSNCSQFFECVGEEIVVMDCPEGLHFNPELLVCDHIWNAGCQKTRGDPRCPPVEEGQNVTLIPNPSNCSQFFECVGEEIVVMDCPEGLHFNPELLVCDHIWNAGCQKARGDPRCPPVEEGQNVTLIPNPSNCSQFFECVGEEIVVMDCPEGLHFNPELLVCDHIWNAGCQKTRGDPRCPPVEEGQNVTLIPNPSNCSQFFECVGEEIVVMDCPEGLHFNPELLVCDHIWNAGCQKTRGDPRCPPVEEGQNVTLIPNPSNCSQFFECVGEEIVVMDCPEGLHFNPELLVCDHIWNAGCQKTRADPRCPHPGSGQNVTFIPNPNNCSQYFECDNGNIIIMDCPSGLHFNPELLVCDHIWNAGCQKTRGDPRCPPVEEGQNVTLIPNPSNCSQFFECVGEEIVVMDCPEGLHFNPELLVCDHIWNAGCQKARGDPRCPPVEEGQNATLIPNPSNCSQFFECVGEEIVVMDCPEGLHFNPELLVCDHIWNAGCQKTRGDLRCPPTSEGHNATLFPHPSNCSLYYECNNGEAILMKCPPDLYFNPVLLVCDFDWEAGCEAESGRLPTCPKPGTEEYEGVAVFPNPRSCSRYFECDNGKLLSMKCPSGLHFNPSKLVCDHKRATGCNV